MALRKFQFNKLVRNNIPANIEKSGGRVKSRTLTQDDYTRELIRKVQEEAAEMRPEDPGELIGEIADVQEAIDCLLVAIGKAKADVTEAQAGKNAKAGSFNNKIYVESVEVPADDPYVEYYLKNSDRYPEL